MSPSWFKLPIQITVTYILHRAINALDMHASILVFVFTTKDIDIRDPTPIFLIAIAALDFRGVGLVDLVRSINDLHCCNSAIASPSQTLEMIRTRTSWCESCPG